MGKLFEELKRRKVFRIAGVYAVVAWVLIQVTDVVLPTFGAPEWVNQTIIFLFILFFPVVVMLAWIYDVTPDNASTSSLEHSKRPAIATSVQSLNYIALVVVLLIASFQVAERFLFQQPASMADIVSIENTDISRQGNL